jgi:prepilin peptidase CpaA
MPVSPVVMKLLLLIPLAVIVIYYDVRFRRIPNVLVLAALIAGVTINISYGGWHGAVSSLGGFAVAFIPMFLMHVFGAMGAGDVKLFAAIGAVVGLPLVPMTFVVVVMLGAVLAIYSMIRSRTVFSTLHGVARVFVGILPGWEMPRFSLPPDRQHTIPYGVAIMIGSVIAVAFFRR